MVSGGECGLLAPRRCHTESCFEVLKSAPYSGHGVTALKGPTLVRTLEGGTYNLVVDHGAADGWSFLSLAGKELGGGMAGGREGLAKFGGFDA